MNNIFILLLTAILVVAVVAVGLGWQAGILCPSSDEALFFSAQAKFLRDKHELSMKGLYSNLASSVSAEENGGFYFRFSSIQVKAFGRPVGPEVFVPLGLDDSLILDVEGNPLLVKDVMSLMEGSQRAAILGTEITVWKEGDTPPFHPDYAPVFQSGGLYFAIWKPAS